MTRIIINLVFAAIVVVPLLTVASGSTIFSLDFFEGAEQLAYDERLRSSVSREAAFDDADQRIVIVDIDQESIDQFGNWPWRRDVIADFISLLLDDARLAVFQDRFSTRDNQTVGIFNDLLDRFYYDDAVLAAIRRIEPEFNYDLRLLNEIDGQEIILGFEFERAGRQIGELSEVAEFLDLQSSKFIPTTTLRSVTRNWQSYEGFLGNEEEFNERALAAGFTNLHTDDDGVIRSYDLVSANAGVRYPSLALVALRYFDDPALPADYLADIGSDYSFVFGASIDTLGTASRLVNLNRNGSMQLNFRSGGGPGRSFSYIPAHQVMSGSAEPGVLEDKIVFVGSSALVISDLWATPVNARMPGIEVHATALQNLLDSSALARPHNAWLAENALLVILAIFMSFSYPKFRVSLTMLISVALLAVVYYLNYEFYWLQHQEVYRIVPFVTLIIALTLVNLISGFAVEYQQKRKVEGVLNQYIPPELAREVNASSQGFSMEGEIREMTILFSDVRGFTTISEQFKAHELTKLMNQMLTALSRQIHANRGTIDKYIGDAVMAFWNAPLDDADHAANAVRGAISMQQAMRKLSEQLEANGQPALNMGVGINTGETCVGNMGSEIRLSYTVMGDAVNLASRLEGITKQYDVDILVGERTYELTKNQFIYRPVDAVRVKGKTKEVMIYQPIGDSRHATNELKRLQSDSLAYWQAYSERRFEEMAVILQKNLELYPNDGLMKIYLARAMKYLEVPPPDDWEPVTNFETK